MSSARWGCVYRELERVLGTVFTDRKGFSPLSLDDPLRPLLPHLVPMAGHLQTRTWPVWWWQCSHHSANICMSLSCKFGISDLYRPYVFLAGMACVSSLSFLTHWCWEVFLVFFFFSCYRNVKPFSKFWVWRELCGLWLVFPASYIFLDFVLATGRTSHFLSVIWIWCHTWNSGCLAWDDTRID